MTPKTIAEAYADAAAEVRAMADFSCGCDPIHCRCRLDRELFGLAADRIEDRAAEVAEPAMPTLAAVIEHYGIDALCKALAPEIVREAGEQRAPWTPPVWQPIETAPKYQDDEDKASSGPMILLASKYGHIAVGYWGRGCRSEVEGWCNPHDHRPMAYWNKFTYWMPLPPLPLPGDAP